MLEICISEVKVRELCRKCLNANLVKETVFVDALCCDSVHVIR